MVIWGNGKEAESFLFQHRDLLKRVECIIKSTEDDDFHGKRVKCYLDIALDKQELVICASNYKVYTEILGILRHKGLIEFRDFIWSKAWGKTIIVVNANCHGMALIKYLNMSKVFRTKYFVFPVPMIQENDDGEIREELLQYADIYIHQDIRSDNKMGYKLSDDYTLRLIKKGCQNITIPNLIGMGHWMFPQLGQVERKCGINVFVDRVMDEAVRNTDGSFGQIKKFWETYEYPDDRLDNLFYKDMEKVKYREKHWDIKVTDFILENYNRLPLFVDYAHPSKYLMRYIGRKVANLLGLNDIKGIDDNSYESFLGSTYPVLPIVKSHFRLNFEYPMETKEVLGVPYNNIEDDYIRNYMWWFYDINL